MPHYIDCSNKRNKAIIEKIINHLSNSIKIADDIGISNLLYNEAYVDLLIAMYVGHKYNIDTQGEDALDKNNNLVEYKCVTKKNGEYSGSFQFHWLSGEKINKYRQCKYFYFAWRNKMTIEKIIRVRAEILMPEIEKKAGRGGSTAGHKSFSCSAIENLVAQKKAEIVFKMR